MGCWAMPRALRAARARRFIAFVPSAAWSSESPGKRRASKRAKRRQLARSMRVLASRAKMIAEQNEKYLDKVRNPLLRKGEFPEEMNFSSTPDRINLRSLQESPGLIA